jgi:hypothetical protein
MDSERGDGMLPEERCAPLPKRPVGSAAWLFLDGEDASVAVERAAADALSFCRPRDLSVVVSGLSGLLSGLLPGPLPMLLALAVKA